MNYMKVAFATLLMAACLLAGCAMENARHQAAQRDTGRYPPRRRMT